jgi:hypothetical protein
MFELLGFGRLLPAHARQRKRSTQWFACRS